MHYRSSFLRKESSGLMVHKLGPLHFRASTVICIMNYIDVSLPQFLWRIYAYLLACLNAKGAVDYMFESDWKGLIHRRLSVDISTLASAAEPPLNNNLITGLYILLPGRVYCPAQSPFNMAKLSLPMLITDGGQK